MEFDFSVTKSPVATAAVMLDKVYVLFSDRTYDVYRNDSGRKGYVALRTLNGSGIVHIAGIDPKRVEAGTLLLFENAKVNRYFCEDKKWDFWWFEFSIVGFISLPLNEVLSIDIHEGETADSRLCLEAIRKNDTCSKGLASAILTLMLYKWMDNFKSEYNNTNPYYKSVNMVIESFYKKIDVGIDVSEMAKMVGLCERRFRTVFEDITGKKPKKYFDEIRMNMAEALLKNTSIKLGEIASRLGFSNQFHFSRKFKEFFGITPSEYRGRL